MEKRISILEHKGHKLLFADLTSLKEEEILAVLEEFKDLAISAKIYLHILDVTNTTTTAKVKESASAISAEVRNKIGKLYSSLIGLRLSQQIIANIINRDQHFASNLEDAKEWLVKKIEKQPGM